MIRTIKLSAKEIKKTDGNGTFISCSAKIGAKWYRIKFTKEAVGEPKKRGLYDLTVDDSNCSLQRGRVKTKADGTQYTENDIFWVNKIEALRKYTEEELAEMNRKTMDGVFGAELEEIKTDDDLPL